MSKVDCTGVVSDEFTGTYLGNVDKTCPKGKDCTGNVKTIFVDLDRILEVTSDATPACMAIYGPNIDETEVENSSDGNYDQCGLLFDLRINPLAGPQSFKYAKWVDLKCNQRTRALMCSILGRLLRFKAFITIHSVLNKTLLIIQNNSFRTC